MNPLPKRYQLLTPLAVIVCNLLLAYAVYFLARIIYLTINYSYFYQDLTLVHLFELLGAGLVFDTSAILVTNIPYIVLMLLCVLPVMQAIVSVSPPSETALRTASSKSVLSRNAANTSGIVT